MPVRSASAIWNGGLKDGKGSFRTETGLTANYSFTSRFGEGGASNPEELLAAAEAACFSMALSGALEKSGAKDTKISSAAKCTVEKVGEGFTITSIALEVRVIAPGLDDATLQRLAEDTRKNCPVSRALTGTKIEVKAVLAQ
ncbi:MAG TPA: OsmC family peroxiredoxin [Gemmatimonadaceae bacterium]|nr:OsmC family peroxiredoxin [Gemmatimonadaceae bacterium]